MRRLENTLTAVLMLSCLTTARTAAAQATPKENIIYALDGYDPSDGDEFSSTNLLVDRAGNLYGTTVDGGLLGSNGLGSGRVFELSPVAGGGWAETTIYSFVSYPKDGAGPTGTLTWDEKGNIYGTTQGGGSGNVGTVYELSPAPDGSWSEKVIYSFENQPYSYFPAGVVFDAQGNLYGITQYGPGNGGGCDKYGGCGTVYELSPSADYQWTFKVIYEFGITPTDLTYPQPFLLIDPGGNLFGTTYNAEYPSPQTGVFELIPQSDGSWTEKTLHKFHATSTDGLYPSGNLLRDRQGNLYGVTSGGGPTTKGYPGGGTVYELEPQADGTWTEKQLFVFPDDSANPVSSERFGYYPDEGLTMDAAGNLYGTTEAGGVATGPFNQGTAFELEPQSDGTWEGKVLHSFPATSTDGYLTNSQVAFDANGNLFGTTGLTEETGSNRYGLGIVYELEAVGPSTPDVTKTSLSLNQSGDILYVNEPITVAATINADISAAVVPTGSVTFTDSTGASVLVPLVAGRAVYSRKVPAAGMYSVTASYSGDVGFAPSKSVVITRMVTPRSED